MLTRKKRKVLFWLSIIAFFLLLGPILIYSAGYRVGPNWTLVKTGGIFIKASKSGASVSVDGSKKKNTSLISGNALIKNIGPGIHRTEVSLAGFLNWKKNLEVETEMVTSREVLLVPTDVKGKMLGTTTIAAAADLFLKKGILYSYDENKKPKIIYSSVKKFWQHENHILILGEDGNFYMNGEPYLIPENWGSRASTILAGKSNSFFADNSTRIIYWNDSGINSYWISDINKMPQWENPNAKKEDVDRYIHIYSTDGEVRGVAEYPGYPDYLLAEISNGIFVLEMDASGGQNVFPIYKGKLPKIISVPEKAEGKLLIVDDGNYIEIELP